MTKTTPRIIAASSLQPGLATIVVSLPDRTIRSRASPDFSPWKGIPAARPWLERL